MVLIGKDLEITSMQTLFLMAMNNEEALSGSEIVEKLEKGLGEEWIPTPGARYKILQSLEERKLIKETTEQEKRKDQRIRTYKLSSEGEEMVQKLSSRVTKLFLFMNSCCPGCCEDIDLRTIRIVPKK